MSLIPCCNVTPNNCNTKKVNPIFIALHNQNRHEIKLEDILKEEVSRSTDHENKFEELLSLHETFNFQENLIDHLELPPESLIITHPPKKMKKLKKREPKSNESQFNTGRWEKEEHERFVEAILKFGNEWKKVQKYVKTRSSTQARSHAQKFFFKIKKSNVLDIDIDLNKNSIKTLYEFANKLDEENYISTIKKLNVIAFEKNSDVTARGNEFDEGLTRFESASMFGRSENEELMFSTDDINIDTCSQLTSSSAFKKPLAKFVEEEPEKIIEKKEFNLKRKRKRSYSSIRVYPDCEITVYDLYKGCDDDEDEEVLNHNFNFFFNQKVDLEELEKEEFEKIFLIKETSNNNFETSNLKKSPYKLFSSEISHNPNLKKKKKKLFQVNPVKSNDFLKQKKIKFATLHTNDIILKGTREDVRNAFE